MDTSSFPPFSFEPTTLFPFVTYHSTLGIGKKHQLPCRPQRANTSPTSPQILSFSLMSEIRQLLFSQVPVRGGQDKGGGAAEEPRQAGARGADR